MAVPYTFGTATAAIPLSQLDSNFATAITLGNTAVYLGNTTTSIGNLTLTNVTISSGEVTTGNVSVAGNVTLTGGTANGVAYLNGSKVLTTGTALAFNGSKLGIGTTSFDAPLQIQAITGGTSVRFNGRASPNDSYTDIAFYNNANTTQVAGIGAANSGLFLATAIASPITFTINNAEAGRFDTGGNLLVGTTSQVSNGLGTFSSSTARSSLSLACTTANQGNNVLYIQKFDNTTTTGTVFVAFAINNGGAGSGQINANGAGAAAFGSYSDSRLKENISELPSQLSNILALRPVEFDYIESEGGGHQIGFIAQEMQEIYPDAVGTRQPDEMLTISGWDKTSARLVKAIQEQQALITTLTDRITALEAK